jgi:hypothetical protein
MAENIVTLDYGSHTTKAGYAHSFPNDSEPRVVRLTGGSVPDTQICMCTGFDWMCEPGLLLGGAHISGSSCGRL